MRIPYGAALSFHLFVIWVVWGLTYTAIAESLDGLPIFSVAGLRFVIAGAFLLGLARYVERAAWPTGEEARSALHTGLLLVAIGDGGIIWACGYVPSGQVAVIVATTPLFALLFEVRGRLAAIPRVEALGVVFGLLGTGLIVGLGGRADGGAREHALGVAVALGASATWAYASLLVKRLRMPRSDLVVTGLQSLAGGLAMLALATVLGEWSTLEIEPFFGRAGAAVAFLIVFSCVLAFTSYQWILRRSTVTLAASFAYVNPLVAVYAGYVWLKEPIGPGVLAGTGLVCGAVALSLFAASRRQCAVPAREGA